MTRFGALLRALGESPSSAGAAWALRTYLAEASKGDAAWALRLLKGEGRAKAVAPAEIRALCLRVTGLPEWIFDECLGTSHGQSRDPLEVAALLAGQAEPRDSGPSLSPSLSEAMERVTGSAPGALLAWIAESWRALGRDGALALNRIACGAIRAQAEAVDGATRASRPADLAGLIPARHVFRAVLLNASFGGADAELSCALLAENGELVTIGRFSSEGLAWNERSELEDWVSANERERFGPVISVPATQVFEIECESIEVSSRRKAGFRLVRARVARWRRDLDFSQADSIGSLTPVQGPQITFGF